LVTFCRVVHFSHEPIANVDILDLSTKSSWSVGESLPTPRENHCAVALDDSRILIVGGSDPSHTPGSATDALVFDRAQPELG